jgi:hypothetical protein
MEEGISSQFACSIPVIVEVLDSHPSVAIEGRAVEVSNTRLQVLLEFEFPFDAAVLVNLGNYLLFGKVVDCNVLMGAYVAPGTYAVNLLIEQFLCLRPVKDSLRTLRDIVASDVSYGGRFADSCSDQPKSFAARAGSKG